MLGRWKNKLGLTGLATLKALSGDPAVAEERLPRISEPRLVSPLAPAKRKEKVYNASQVDWFTKKLRDFEKQDLPQMEKLVNDDSVPLHLQVEFARHVFGERGLLYTELTQKITDERLSEILGLNSSISGRLSRAYAKKDLKILTHPYLKPFFGVHRMQKASKGRHFQMVEKLPNGKELWDYANVTLYKFEDEIFEATARHVVFGSKEQSSWTLSDTNADAAVRHVPKARHAEYLKEYKLENFDFLPELSGLARMGSVAGDIIVSFSEDLRGQRVADFSIAMPFSDEVRNRLYRDPSVKYPDLKNSFIFLKPDFAGHVLEYDEKGKIRRHGSSGESGGGIAIRTHTGFNLISVYAGVRVLLDGCKKLCYAVANAPSPEILNELTRRAHKRYLESKLDRSFRALP